MLKLFRENLGFRLFVHFVAGWPIVTIVIRIGYGYNWETSIAVGSMLTVIVILISLFVIIRKRNE